MRHPTSDYQYFTVSHNDVVRSVMSRCIYVIAIHNTKCAVILYIIWMERVREIPTEDDTSTQNLGANKHTTVHIYIYIYIYLFRWNNDATLHNKDNMLLHGQVVFTYFAYLLKKLIIMHHCC